MQQSVRYVEGVAIIDIKGEIIGDARFESEELISQEIAKSPKGLLLNLEEVAMVDSIWLGMVCARAKDLERKRNGEKLGLLNVGRSVRYLLIVTKLETWSEYKILSAKIDSYNDENEAIASFAKK